MMKKYIFGRNLRPILPKKHRISKDMSVNIEDWCI